MNGGGAGNFLSEDGLFTDEEDLNREQRLAEYRHWLYKIGNATRVRIEDIEAGRANDGREWGFAIPEGEKLLRRMRFFSYGLVIGSREFIMDATSVLVDW